MPYNIDPKQEAAREKAKEFCEKEVIPVAKDLDRRPEPQVFPKEYFKKLGDAGFVGYAFPKEYGGGGYSNLEYATVIEELAYYDPPTCLLAAVQELAAYPIMVFGNEEQKKKYLPPAARGETILSFVLTEPEAGSDAANQQTSAVPEGDNYILNGEKIFIMHGDVCDTGVVFCRIQEEGVRDKVSAIIVDMDSPGIEQKTLEYKMGMKAATTGRIWFKDVKVPKKNLLGEPGKGFRYAMQTLDGARIGVAAQGVGIGQRALDESISYAKKRVQFGSPIAKLQAIQWKIADMSTQVEAARLLTYKAAMLQDEGKRFSLEACHAKLFASEMANFCVDEAMQIHGGYGFIEEFSIIGKLYRDQRVTEIYEGTSEVQRLVIASSLLR